MVNVLMRCRHAILPAGIVNDGRTSKPLLQENINLHSLEIRLLFSGRCIKGVRRTIRINFFTVLRGSHCPLLALKLWRGQKRCRRGEERRGEERRGERRGCSPLACLESRFPVNLLLVLDHADRRTRLTKESRIFLHGSTQRRKTMALTWGTESMAQQDKHTHTDTHSKGTHNQHKCGKMDTNCKFKHK